MWTGLTSIFSFPQGSCSFLPVVLVPELHTPVCEKLCWRKLQLLSWQLTLEPPESSSPPQCQSCILALWIAAVCNSTAYTNLPQRAGLGWAFLPLVALTSYASFGWVLYCWLSSLSEIGSVVRPLCVRPRAWEQWDFQKSEQHDLKVIWMHGSRGCKNWDWKYKYPGEKKFCFITALTRS